MLKGFDAIGYIFLWIFFLSHFPSIISNRPTTSIETKKAPYTINYWEIFQRYLAILVVLKAFVYFIKLKNLVIHWMKNDFLNFSSIITIDLI